MITQAIKGWLHKVFAWWPWKQSPSIEYQHVTSAVSRGSAQEMSPWLSQEGTVPQTGATPRRFLLENRAERLAQPRPEVSDMPPLSPLAPVSKPVDTTAEGPTPQQRLEFLRYLVQHGLVNEGFEHDRSDPI
jgi:hypothetical protein